MKAGKGKKSVGYGKSSSVGYGQPAGSMSFRPVKKKKPKRK